MKNIHVLPTDKPSRLHFDSELFISTKYQLSTSINSIVQGRNIYITNSEEIKEGDCKLDTFHNQVSKVININSISKYDKKIILTTDQDLIEDGIQSINDDFLEWFVKNPSCEFVEVQSERRNWKEINYIIVYKIIIPKEESKQEWNPTQGEEVWIKVFSNWSKGIYIGYDVTKETHIVREDDEGGGHLMSSSQVLPYCEIPNKTKQETLEEAAENSYRFEADSNFPDEEEHSEFVRIFKKGAKWQAKTMYSEEDLREAYKSCYTPFSFDRIGDLDKDFSVWFEQFKNK